jgi:hypothetical protein
MTHRALIVLMGLLATGAVVSQATIKHAPSGRVAQEATLAATVLKGSDTMVRDGFGESVALSGDTMVVGAPGHRGGRAYIFIKRGDGWYQAAELGAGRVRSAWPSPWPATPSLWVLRERRAVGAPTFLATAAGLGDKLRC